METKTCKRCGAEKPLIDYRSYYGKNQNGTYTFCKECERIESRRKYLAKLGDAANPTQRAALASIERLYAEREIKGLSVPKRRSVNTTDDIVAKHLQGDCVC